LPHARIWRGVLCLAIGLWVAALLLAPAALFPIGAFICHQRPERSFFVHGQQLPVCARCTGLYAGALLAAPLALLTAGPLVAARARTLLALAALPTLITWILEFAGFAHFSNIVRFTAALPLGGAASWLVFAVTDGRSGTVRARDAAQPVR
jgi:uncharacterized membrane protein